MQGKLKKDSASLFSFQALLKHERGSHTHGSHSGSLERLRGDWSSPWRQCSPTFFNNFLRHILCGMRIFLSAPREPVLQRTLIRGHFSFNILASHTSPMTSTLCHQVLRKSASKHRMMGLPFSGSSTQKTLSCASRVRMMSERDDDLTNEHACQMCLNEEQELYGLEGVLMLILQRLEHAYNKAQSK